MTKRTLAEAAQEILGANLSAKMGHGEPFGAGKTASGVNTPGQSGKAEDMGGPIASAADAGVAAAVAKAPRATPPGATPPVGSEPAKNLMKGEPGKDRAKASASGIVEEEEGGSHSNFKKDTTKKPMELGEEKDDDDDDKDMDDKDDDDKDDMHEEGLGLPEVEPVSQRVKSYVQSKTGVNVAEDIEAIFAGEELSEAFMTKARKIYEAAVIAAATNVCEEIESQYAETLDVVAEQLQEELTEKVDDYLNYMVEEWVSENEIAIETGLKAELTEDFISGLRNLFVEHYIDIPEDKVNVVEELAKKVEELEESLNEEIERGVKLNKQLAEQTRRNVLHTVSEGLTETQTEKLYALSEGVDFSTAEEYKDNLLTLRESYFPTKAASKKQVLEEEVTGDGTFDVEKTVPTEMQQYVKAISKTRPV